MNVGPVRVDQSADRARVSADLRMAGDTRELWFEIRGNAPYRPNGTEVDAFAVAAWLIAVDRAEPEAVLDGAVSPTLVHNLSHQAAPILRLAVPTFGRAVLRAPVRGESPPPATGVATGFSGGIDSFCTIADYLVDDPLPSYRLSHLVFSNVGANGRGSGGAHLFSKR